jgi:hypothetical protein
MVPWLLNHRQIWRASLLLLLGLAIFAPWGYTSDGVPPPEWCAAPYILLEDGRCVGKILGAEIISFMLITFREMLGRVLLGDFTQMGSWREFFGPLAFSLFILPLLSGLLVLFRESPRLQAVHIVLICLSIAFSLLLALPSLGSNPIFLWGFWLYILCAGCALCLELIIRITGASWKSPPAHLPSIS